MKEGREYLRFDRMCFWTSVASGIKNTLKYPFFPPSYLWWCSVSYTPVVCAWMWWWCRGGSLSHWGAVPLLCNPQHAPHQRQSRVWCVGNLIVRQFWVELGRSSFTVKCLAVSGTLAVALQQPSCMMNTLSTTCPSFATTVTTIIFMSVNFLWLACAWVHFFPGEGLRQSVQNGRADAMEECTRAHQPLSLLTVTLPTDLAMNSSNSNTHMHILQLSYSNLNGSLIVGRVDSQ